MSDETREIRKLKEELAQSRAAYMRLRQEYDQCRIVRDAFEASMKEREETVKHDCSTLLYARIRLRDVGLSTNEIDYVLEKFHKPSEP